MAKSPDVSVIIPTYNRKWFLRETLDSLSGQTFPASNFEVIVVDDGSTESYQDVISRGFPFKVQYIYQVNKGDAEARNVGALKSAADLLVFLDDDILVSPGYLEAIVEGQHSGRKRIIVGTAYLWTREDNPLQMDRSLDLHQAESSGLSPVDFTEICSNNMSIRKGDYASVGFMDSLDFPGSSMWCDVDFSYRAYLKGFEFYRANKAVCWHRDYVAMNLQNQNRRWREAATRAVALFQKHPGLIRHLPMFADKTPVEWGKDPPAVVLRKLTRRIASSRPALRMLEFIERTLSGGKKGKAILPHLHRWIVGGYIYQGFRDGLRMRLSSGS